MKIKNYIVILVSAFAAAGCSLIDDDLSACGVDYFINYQMHLVTEIHTTIDAQLSSEVEKPIANMLKKWSDPYFNGQAHDLDMSFFSMDGTDELRHHTSDIINANQKSYTLYIPREDYRHLAVVNLKENDNLTLMGGQYMTSMRLSLSEKDTLPSHPTAVYTARMDMRMGNVETDLSFNVRLYMVSSAVAIIITNNHTAVPKMSKILVEGTATGFVLNDSTYLFKHNTLTKAEKLSDVCYAVMTMPSREATSSVPSTRGNARSTNEDAALWNVRVYTNMPDGKVTETVLSVNHPLKAGTMDIIKVQINDDGSVTPVGTTDIGATVTLDWKSGGEHEMITE